MNPDYEITASKLDEGTFEIWHKPTRNRVLSLMRSEAEAVNVSMQLTINDSFENRRKLQYEIDKQYASIQGLYVSQDSEGWYVSTGRVKQVNEACSRGASGRF